MLAERANELGLGSADQEIILVPVPLAAEVIVSQAALDTALHDIPAGLTVSEVDPTPPVFGVIADGGVKVKLPDCCEFGSNTVTE